jgi:hypothetical protein
MTSRPSARTQPTEPDVRRPYLGLALCLAGLALVLASVLPWLAVLSGVAALLTGLRAVWRDLLADRTIRLSGSSVAISVLALMVCFWPGLLYPSASNDAPELPTLEVVQREPGAWPRCPGEKEWVCAQDFDYKIGDLSIRVAEVKQVRRSGSMWLSVHVAIANRGSKPATYQGWGGLRQPSALHQPRLTDDAEQVYSPRFQVRNELPEHTVSIVLSGGKEIREALLFAAVPREAAAFHLELPATTFGLPGSLRWKIPRDMIRQG